MGSSPKLEMSWVFKTERWPVRPNYSVFVGMAGDERCWGGSDSGNKGKIQIR